MNKLFLFVLMAGAACAAELAPVAPAIDCTQLKTADFSGVAGAPMQITDAVAVNDGKPAAYCKVTGYVSPHVDFEVRLPLAGWTQRFLQTGCGGLCGSLNIRVGNADGCLPAERGEFALASTDMGHKGMGGDWGGDPNLRIDFAYRGVHVTALAAKAIIAKYYGQPAKHSYFAGCSDGGREALMEAERFPDDFDGITAGAPAMNFITQNTFYHAWNASVNTGADGRAILTADKLPILHAAVVAACDALDGLKDGLIQDPRACHFDPSVTVCKAGQDPAACLTKEQAEVARKIYRGAHDADGRQLVISGPQPGSELAWRGVYVPNNPSQPIFSRQIALDTIRHLIYAKNPPPDSKLEDFHFDEPTFDAIKPMHALYDATNPDLKAFSAHGGKLILWHGWSDPHISPLNTIAYYSAVERYMGAKRAAEFVRLYLFPGGYHCGGGEGPFDVDLLSPIMAWVESRTAPGALVAKHTARPGAQPDRTRPVFPYPMVAAYTGSGSVDEAGNFVAKRPARKFNDEPDWLGKGFFRP